MKDIGKNPPVQTRYEDNIRNIQGTFAAEGMSLSPSALSNLERISTGKASYQQVLEELRGKYGRKD